MAKILRRGRAARGVCAAMLFWFSVSVGLRADETLTKRIETLRVEIARHDELYFKKSAPEISDEAYDRLKRELAELESRTGVEPQGNLVGDDRDGRFSSARHGERMMSLAKVYSETELRAFLKRVDGDAASRTGGWVIEPKYDGLAVSATYERGRLVRLVTRGNGIEGDDVTVNAPALAGLPIMLNGASWPERIEVRGEVFVSFSEFERVNAGRAEAGETLFANPRALAAGSLKLSEPAEAMGRGLSVVFHGWGEVAPKSVEPKSQHVFHERVRAWGLPGVSEMRAAKTADEVVRYVEIFERERASLAFPTDGVVIKLDDVAARERLGATDYAPRWAVAYKFSTERAETRVKGITVQVGRTGVLTPVAELEPVRLGGSTVTRASLHNTSEIARLDVRVSDAVWVEKAGEIIPEVTGVNRARRKAESAEFVFPADCPSCGAAVVTRTQDGAKQFCPNWACEAQVIARLVHFSGAQGVAIRGVGKETIVALVRQRGLRSAADLYRLRKEDWLALPGISVKSAEKLQAAVEASRRAELWRFVHGLGVPDVGVATSRVLAAKYSTLDAIAAASERELGAIDGVGAVQAQRIGVFFLDERTRKLLEDFAALGVRPARRNAERDAGVLSGKKFVLTGTLPTLTRAQAVEKIVAAGGVVGESVIKSTDFVVAGTGAGEKRARAKALGVRIIDEVELLRLLSGSVTDQ